MLFVQVWNHGLGVQGEVLVHTLRDACLALDWPMLKEKNGLCVRVVNDGPADAGPVCVVVKYWSNHCDISQVCRLLMETVERFFTETIKRPRDVVVLPEKGAGIWA